MKRTLLLFILLHVIVFQTIAQDDHYWSQQFGAASTLMGGSVVAGVRDNTAIYYNPGALGFISQPSLSVDANVYEIDKIFIDDGLGNGINLNSAQLSIYPQIISGLVNLVKNDRWKFSYALMTKQYSNVLINSRFTDSDFDPTLVPPNVRFIGALDYTNQLNEQWLGLGVGYRINDHLSVGGTLFVSYRAQSYQMTNYERLVLLDVDTLFGSYNNDRNLKFKTFSGLFKFGLAYQTGRWKLGFTVTTPSVQVYGSGDIQREESVVFLASTAGDGYVVMGRKSGIKAKYHRPLSIGMGVEYATAKTRITFSCEYFARLNPYHIFEPESNPFIYPPLSDSMKNVIGVGSFLHVVNAARPVFNVAIGFSQDLGTKFTLLLGARTDFSSFSAKDSIEADNFLHMTGSWDLYHLSAGLSYHQKRNTVTIGFKYSFSPPTKLINLGILDPIEEDSPMSPKVYDQSFGLIIGYTYYFPK